MTQDKNHCKSCGEWLQGFDTCGACGMIQKYPNRWLSARFSRRRARRYVYIYYYW